MNEKQYMKSADIPPAAGSVITQAIAMFRNRDQSTERCVVSFELTRPKAQPTETTLPTLQWVVEIGRPILLANRTVADAPFSMTKPVAGVIFVKFVPRVSTHRLPKHQRPATIPMPPKKRIKRGDSASCLADPSV